MSRRASHPPRASQPRNPRAIKRSYRTGAPRGDTEPITAADPLIFKAFPSTFDGFFVSPSGFVINNSSFESLPFVFFISARNLIRSPLE